MSGSPDLSKREMDTLAADVLRLSRMFTRRRGAFPPAYLKDRGLRNAYRLYFLPANIRKIHVPLRELSCHLKSILAKDRLRILDIGSGPGTAILGMLDYFSRQEQKPVLEFTAVDPVAENLSEAEELFRGQCKRYAGTASLRTIASGIEGLAVRLGDRHDVIVFSNVLNELFPGDQQRIARRVQTVRGLLNQSLARDGSCFIIEPALRDTSRELLEVRDALPAAGLHIYSPCLSDDRCPALENPRDWCHEDIPWDPPQLVQEIDRRIGLRKDSLKFSYLVVRKDALSLRDSAGIDSFRVVSEPLVTKGKVEYYLCRAGERRLVTRLDRDRTSRNKSFDELGRGDTVRFENLVDEQRRFKVGGETSVVRTGSPVQQSGR